MNNSPPFDLHEMPEGYDPFDPRLAARDELRDRLNAGERFPLHHGLAGQAGVNDVDRKPSWYEPILQYGRDVLDHGNSRVHQGMRIGGAAYDAAAPHAVGGYMDQYGPQFRSREQLGGLADQARGAVGNYFGQVGDLARSKATGAIDAIDDLGRSAYGAAQHYGPVAGGAARALMGGPAAWAEAAGDAYNAIPQGARDAAWAVGEGGRDIAQTGMDSARGGLESVGKGLYDAAQPFRDNAAANFQSARDLAGRAGRGVRDWWNEGEDWGGGPSVWGRSQLSGAIGGIGRGMTSMAQFGHDLPAATLHDFDLLDMGGELEHNSEYTNRYSRLPPGSPERAQMRAEVQAQAAQPPEDTWLGRTGRQISQYGEQHFPLTPTERESVTGQAGSAIGTAGPAILTGMVNPPAGIAMGAGQFGLLGGQEARDRAAGAGANPEAQRNAAAQGAGANAMLGVIPFQTVMRPIQRVSPGLASWLAARAQGAAQGSAAFFATGEASKYVMEEIAREAGDPNAQYHFDAKQAMASLVSGGFLGAAGRTPLREPLQGGRPGTSVNGWREGYVPPLNEIWPGENVPRGARRAEQRALENGGLRFPEQTDYARPENWSQSPQNFAARRPEVQRAELGGRIDQLPEQGVGRWRTPAYEQRLEERNRQDFDRRHMGPNDQAAWDAVQQTMRPPRGVADGKTDVQGFGDAWNPERTEGGKAHNAGIEANPHPPGSPNFRAWDSGWSQQQAINEHRAGPQRERLDLGRQRGGEERGLGVEDLPRYSPEYRAWEQQQRPQRDQYGQRFAGRPDDIDFNGREFGGRSRNPQTQALDDGMQRAWDGMRARGRDQEMLRARDQARGDTIAGDGVATRQGLEDYVRTQSPEYREAWAAGNRPRAEQPIWEQRRAQPGDQMGYGGYVRRAGEGDIPSNQGAGWNRGATRERLDLGRQGNETRASSWTGLPDGYQGPLYNHGRGQQQALPPPRPAEGAGQEFHAPVPVQGRGQSASQGAPRQFQPPPRGQGGPSDYLDQAYKSGLRPGEYFTPESEQTPPREYSAPGFRSREELARDQNRGVDGGRAGVPQPGAGRAPSTGVPNEAPPGRPPAPRNYEGSYSAEADTARRPDVNFSPKTERGGEAPPWQQSRPSVERKIAAIPPGRVDRFLTDNLLEAMGPAPRPRADTERVTFGPEARRPPPWQEALKGKPFTAAGRKLASERPFGEAAQSRLVLSEKAQQQRPEIEAALTKLVQKIAGPDVRVAFPDRIPVQGKDRDTAIRDYGAEVGGRARTAAGSYSYNPNSVDAQALIRIALADPAQRMPISAALHEPWHHVEGKLLTTPERTILENNTERLRARLQRKTGPLRSLRSPDTQPHGGAKQLDAEEVRAIAFQEYTLARANGENNPPGYGPVSRVFNKLYNTFDRVRNGLHNRGFQTADDIFANAGEGKYAKRPPGQDWEAKSAYARSITGGDKPLVNGLVEGAQAPGGRAERSPFPAR